MIYLRLICRPDKLRAVDEKLTITKYMEASIMNIVQSKIDLIRKVLDEIESENIR